MDELQKLFDVVSQKGLYTKSFEEFKAKYSDDVNREKLFGVVSEKGLYTKTYEDFNNKYFTSGQAPVQSQTPDAVEPKGVQAEGNGDSVSPSVDMNSSSESKPINNDFNLDDILDEQARRRFYEQLKTSTPEQLQSYGVDFVPPTYEEYAEKNPTFGEKMQNANVFEQQRLIEERDEQRRTITKDLYERANNYSDRKRAEVVYKEMKDKTDLSEADVINIKSEYDRIKRGDLTLWETMEAYTLGAIENPMALANPAMPIIPVMPNPDLAEMKSQKLDRKKIDFMKDMDDDDRNVLQEYMQYSPDGSRFQMEELNRDNEELLKQSAFLEDRMLKYTDTPVYKEYERLLKQNKQSAIDYIQGLPKDQKAELMNAHTKIMDLYEIHQGNMEKFNSTEDDLQSYAIEADLARKHFGLGTNMAISYVDSAFGIMGGALNAGLDPIVEYTKPEDKTYEEHRESLIDGTLLNYMEESVESNAEMKLGRRLNDNPFSLERISLLAAEQLPVLATVATGGGGLAVIGASTYGNKVKEYGEDGSITWEDRLAAGLTAGGEVLSERVTQGILTKGGRAFKAAKKEGRLSDLFTVNFVKGTLASTGEEGGSEVLARLVENFSDIYITGDTSKTMLDGLKDSFIDGAIMGGMMRATPEIVGSTMGQFYGNTAQLNKIKATDAEIRKLTAEAMKPEVSDEAFDVLEERVADLRAKNTRRVNDYIDNVEKLDESEMTDLNKIAKASLKEKSALAAIQKDPSLSEEVKNELSTVYKNRIKELENAKETILEKANKKPKAKAGNRLFNDPNPETASIVSEYKKANNIQTPDGQPITELDVEFSKEIADAYEAMENNPSDPEVRESYEAMANETLSQYEAMVAKGYTVEMYEGKGEPYANSQEMIADLRDNKHLYIFSTEQGYGSDGITDEQRQENILLQDAGVKDKNGKPMLFNDVFRGVHDFFGHSDRGNGFGAKGEENAWDVHARMYSDKARRAMTAETRGQNSWVNFGGQMRNEDGSIKKKGDEGYLLVKDRPFAPQKIGLLPEKYSQIRNDEQNKTEGTPTDTKGKEGATEKGQDKSNPTDAGTKQTGRAKEIADKIRSYKTNTTLKDAMSSLNSGIPKELFEIAWDGAIEVAAQTVEFTGNIAESVQAGIDALKNSEWYENLSPEGKGKAERMMREDMSREFGSEEVNNPSFLDSVKASYNRAREIAIQRFVDKYYIVKQEIKRNFKKFSSDGINFSRAEKLMHGKAANDLEVFDVAMEKIMNKVFDAGFNVQQISDWLYAKHAGERNAHIQKNINPENPFGSGMTPQVAQKILEGTYNSDEIAKLEELAGEFRNIIEETRQIMLDSGLITQEQYNTFSDYYENYVPLQGFENEELEGTSDIQGKSINVKGNVARRAAGRSTRADNVIASIIAQRTSAVMKARKNEVLETLYNLAQAEPNNGVFQLFKAGELPKKTKVDSSGTVSKQQENPENRKDYVGVKVQGEQYYLKFANAELGRVLNAANIEKTDIITKTLGRLNRFLSTTLTTLDPEFVISNFARDIQTAVYNLKAEGDINEALGGRDLTNGIIKDTFKAIGAIYGNERSGKDNTEFRRYYEEFKNEGAKTGWANQNNLQDIKKKLEGLHKMREAKAISMANAKKKLKDAFEFVEDVNTSVENGVRLAAYINARKSGLTKPQAAEIAKELTVNFNKSGEWGTLFNSLFLFFNASIQGSVRFAKAMGTMKKTVRPDGTVKKSLNRGQKIAMGVTAFSSVVTMLNQAISDEDEDGQSFYSKIPDYEKERNFIFMNPANGQDYFKIPLPYGYNIFHNLGSISTEVASGERSVGDGIGFLTSSTINSFVPVSFGGGEEAANRIASSLAPTIAKPIVALAVNEDHFGSQIYNENLPFGVPKPDSAMGRKSTPEAYKAISKFLNEASGGNDYESGAMDFAPESLYYISKFFVGGTGRFVGNTAETIGTGIDAAKGKPVDLELRKVPFVRKLYAEPNEFVDQSTFFDRYEMIRQRSLALTEKMKTRDITPEERSNLPKVKATEKIYDEISKKLSEIRKQKKQVENIEDPIRRAERLNVLEDRYFKLIKKANGTFNKRLGENYE